ncbi:MAG: serine/threonine protein kinase, partial [Lachnospiraceae bacterium]|nr:serine/threonine protein kinase [Lachnospiraceae bacterium]
TGMTTEESIKDFLQDWQIVRRIGSGSYGMVFEIAKEDFGTVYRAALKVISIPQNFQQLGGLSDQSPTRENSYADSKGLVEEMAQEFALMAKVKGHTNVVSYEDHKVYYRDEDPFWNIMIRMELLTPLKSYLQIHSFEQEDVVKVGIDICKALEICSHYGIIHRDIKLENIFVSDTGDYKLGDFGIAKAAENRSDIGVRAGTSHYMAPEIFRGEAYGLNADIYALGMVLYRLLNGNRPPFCPPYPQPLSPEEKKNALIRRISGERLPDPAYAGGRVAQIIRKACEADPGVRYQSPADMKKDLEVALREADWPLAESGFSGEAEGRTTPMKNDSISEDLLRKNIVVFDEKGLGNTKPGKSFSVFGFISLLLVVAAGMAIFFKLNAPMAIKWAVPAVCEIGAVYGMIKSYRGKFYIGILLSLILSLLVFLHMANSEGLFIKLQNYLQDIFDSLRLSI